MKTKYSNSLIYKAHYLAFKTDMDNKAIAKKLKITKGQLRYVLYQHKSKPILDEMYIERIKQDIEDSDKLLRKEKELTITESFLDFFTLEEYK